MFVKILPTFIELEKDIISCVENFDNTGMFFYNSNRNKVKIFNVNKLNINIKFFKIPIVINKIAYRYFRKSKAQRSFEYALTLLEKGIETPNPIGYVEFYSFLGLRKSYYFSEHFQYDLTFSDLIKNPYISERENIIRQFTQFTFQLHEKGIFFKDHSSTNTLIKKTNNGKYRFLLVDLNRMSFNKKMSFDKRMKNFCRLTNNDEIIKIISNEYAKYYPQKNENLIYKAICNFIKKMTLKNNLKRKVKEIFGLSIKNNIKLFKNPVVSN